MPPSLMNDVIDVYYCTDIREEINKEQDIQNPPTQKENGGRNLATIPCYFPMLATVFYSKFRLQYKVQQYSCC